MQFIDQLIDYPINCASLNKNAGQSQHTLFAYVRWYPFYFIKSHFIIQPTRICICFAIYLHFTMQYSQDLRSLTISWQNLQASKKCCFVCGGFLCVGYFFVLFCFLLFFFVLFIFPRKWGLTFCFNYISGNNLNKISCWNVKPWFFFRKKKQQKHTQNYLNIVC